MNKLDYAFKMIEMLASILEKQNLSNEDKEQLKFVTEKSKGLRNV